ncbi:LacI family DNA-binding transcriptional regulator [Microbacterium halotolerans]|uniref:LacI family DNA-binding transcriptional regulator n=1 Tax=Microbacterium halotolerans TaxID=246613 RepID=UPI000E6AC538|nr:LacI family DNA-binding transcriptional regulator [Microbacterium halotolerans]
MSVSKLNDVAAAAGVSLSTASKAINGRQGISEEARAKVSRAVEELAYRHKPRAALSHATPKVTILFNHFSGPHTGPYTIGILSGAAHAANRAGAELVTTTLDGQRPSDRPLATAWLQDLANRGNRGLIVVTGAVTDAQVRWCRKNRLPLILIDPASANSEHVVTIGSTNWTGGWQAAEHLLGLGHRRIGFVRGPVDSLPAGERLQGFRSAMHAADVSIDETLLAGTGFTPESGRAAAHEILDRDDRPTAVFAASDDVALGVFRAAERLGLSIPHDLSVVGFDDTAAASWTSPALTTVRQPLASIGQVAVERVLALADDPERFAHPFQLETRLVVRRSTSAPAV